MVGVVVAVSLLAVQVIAGVTRDVLSDQPTALELVETCLTERERPFERVVDDLVAASAERGALRTDVDGNSVTVALGGSEKDAERVHAAYVAVAPADVVRTRLERNRKVVLLWSLEPSQEQREFIHLCTRDAQE